MPSNWVQRQAHNGSHASFDWVGPASSKSLATFCKRIYIIQWVLAGADLSWSSASSLDRTPARIRADICGPLLTSVSGRNETRKSWLWLQHLKHLLGVEPPLELQHPQRRHIPSMDRTISTTQGNDSAISYVQTGKKFTSLARPKKRVLCAEHFFRTRKTEILTW
jgi:hypothetical protein